MFSPDWAAGGPNLVPSPHWAEDPRYYVNLNEVERRTWAQILEGQSVSAIARNESVTRQAIYGRLLGWHGYGGMISKNFWVLLWCIARGLYPRDPGRKTYQETNETAL